MISFSLCGVVMNQVSFSGLQLWSRPACVTVCVRRPTQERCGGGEGDAVPETFILCLRARACVQE